MLRCFRQPAAVERESMLHRFDKQITIKQIGEAGQQRLAAAKVAVVGAGGLGSPVITYLAAAGVGTLCVIDGDTVELSNLNRQFVHGTQSLAKEKADSARAFVARTFGDVRVEPVVRRLDARNATELLAGCDVVVDCVDNIPTRLLVCKAALSLGVPLVEGGIDGFYGFVTAVRAGTACLGCAGYDAPADKAFSSLGAVAGIIGSMQALETVKILLGMPDVAYNKLLLFDGIRSELDVVQMARRADCPVCGNKNHEQ